MIHKTGDKVAWKLLDGHTMTGTIESVWGGQAYVKRVDGTMCGPIALFRLRTATYDEVMESCQYYTRDYNEPKHS